MRQQTGRAQVVRLLSVKLGDAERIGGNGFAAKTGKHTLTQSAREWMRQQTGMGMNSTAENTATWRRGR
jgi:hypothetical protein